MERILITLLFALLSAPMPSCLVQSKQPRTYTTEELKELGVNTEHLFEFTDTTMCYNGTRFMIGESIGRMVEIFGPYDRRPTNTGIYIWDELGIVITTNLDVIKEINPPINGISIEWNLDMTGHDYPTISNEELHLREMMIERTPKKKFQGKILVYGVPLGRGMTVDTYMEEALMVWPNEPFPRIYRWNLDDLDYSKVNIPDYYRITYHIYVSDDQSDIEYFEAGVTYR